jgi:hypothetical protein
MKQPRLPLDRAALNRKEEALLVLFRELSAHQQDELLNEMTAMQEANRIARSQLKRGKLDAVSNEEVREKFKDVPPPVASNGRPKPL